MRAADRLSILLLAVNDGNDDDEDQEEVVYSLQFGLTDEENRPVHGEKLIYCRGCELSKCC
jgi:hypothetical protein